MTETSGTDDYADFIRRIRAGDAQAAEEVVRRFEREIRLEVRTCLRLRDARLRRVFDSMDVCQSVLGSFFVRRVFRIYPALIVVSVAIADGTPVDV